MRFRKVKAFLDLLSKRTFVFDRRGFAKDVSNDANASSLRNKDRLRDLECSLDRIRNFCIIAHVDHGKSTLADRLMELTGAIETGSKSQILDKLQVERERGITIKAQTASIVHRYQNVDYLLNLIDTPGHVDFSYEVRRSIAACQGALLLVDATQGIQAQTVANFQFAFEEGLDVFPVINKIDLPTADSKKVSAQLEAAFTFKQEEISLISAKTGKGVQQLLDRIVKEVEPPKGDPNGNLRVLLLDAEHDVYRGVICLVKVIDGSLRSGMRISSIATRETYEILELGFLTPESLPVEALKTGQVGYVITGMKSTRSARMGDTWHLEHSSVPPLPGFAPAKANVFCGLYPTNMEDFDTLQSAMDRLTLNDASVTIKKETSGALGYGFRCGFLGALHMDVFCERLSKEYGADVIITTPTVPYKVTLANGDERVIENPCDFPTQQKIQFVQEPTVLATVMAPEAYTGVVMELCISKRGTVEEHSLVGDRVLLRYVLGLAELVDDFFSQLKSLTKGFASLDYVEGTYRKAELQRLDLLVNGKPVDAFARIVHKDRVFSLGRQLCQKLKALLGRQQFEVVLQASSNGRIVSREVLSALRKNVLAKCYGGDVSRKRKLLEKQKEGKKRMKSIGVVNVPTEAFHELVKLR